ncbi:MAG: hypothetical protein PHN57_02455 [Candidatus Omnitrophica bacterium]|nr:hypothetical protein [Candidatus Omnitrophota bacterium]
MKKNAIILVSLFFLSGCATYYTVRTNGYLDTVNTAGRIPVNSSFCVLTSQNARNPILETEIKLKIEKLLTQRGYRIESFEKADFALSFIYTMGPGRTVTEITPVYSPPETGTIQTFSSSGRTRTSIITYPSHTAYVPYRETVYTSSLTIEVSEANSLKSSREEKKIWIGEAYSTSVNPDLRDAVNYLLVGAFEHFGENTGRSLIANIAENDSRIKWLQQ